MTSCCQNLMFTKATDLLSNSEADLETMMHCENSACDMGKCDIVTSVEASNEDFRFGKNIFYLCVWSA